MRKNIVNSPQQTEDEETLSIIVEQILHESLLEFRKEQLRKEIDDALRDRNKEDFLILSEQLIFISNS